MIVLNDLHLGLNRQAGTTGASKMALQQYAMDAFEELVLNSDETLVINGDLFDSFEVDLCTLIDTYSILKRFVDSGGSLHLVSGNHDYSPKGHKLSSFHALARLLPDNVDVIDHELGLSWLGNSVWAIPHMPNQDLFNIEIDKACACECRAPGFLLLHANCDNEFAEHSDHSLNVTRPQLERLVEAGWTVIFAHEHQAKSLMGGKVIVVGNQFPTSIADCLGNDEKHYISIRDGVLEQHTSWFARGSFAQVDWTALDNFDGPAKFIRVTGSAEAESAADVVSTVAKFRQKSNAYVVTNSVSIGGLAEMDSLVSMSFDSVSKFDVLGALKEELTEREFATVEGLLNA